MRDRRKMMDSRRNQRTHTVPELVKIDRINQLHHYAFVFFVRFIKFALLFRSS